MKKKIITILISIVLVLAATVTLTGCSMFSTDDIANMRQVVATVSYGDNLENTRNIYKFELNEAVWQASNQGQIPVTERLVNHALQSLIDNEFVQIEIERKFRDGDLVWRGGGQTGDDEVDYADTNEFRRTLFDSIDNELRAEQRRIYAERDIDVPDDQPPPPAPAPEFPIREPDVDNAHIVEPTLFVPMSGRFPGAGGSADRISIETTAFRRFVNRIIDNVENAVREHDEDLLQADRDFFNQKFAAGDFASAYQALVPVNPLAGSPAYLGADGAPVAIAAGSYALMFLAGNSVRDQIKETILDRSLAYDVVVEASEVARRFNQERDAQIAQFRANPAAYSSAVSGNQRIFYRPNNNYFYVKHVLLPFTDAQTDRLSAFRERQGVTIADITNFRDVQLVNEIRVFARMEDGFNDYSRTFTAHEVFNLIRGEVAAASGSMRTAHRRFDDFIYMFNTDPGAFTHHFGYAQNRNRAAGTGFMAEFAEAAWTLNEQFEPGDVFPEMAITDFGVHIMFFAGRTTAGWTAQLDSFETPSEYQTWFDVFYEELRTHREREQINRWAGGIIRAARGNSDSYTIFHRRFRDLWN